MVGPIKKRNVQRGDIFNLNHGVCSATSAFYCSTAVKTGSQNVRCAVLTEGISSFVRDSFEATSS